MLVGFEKAVGREIGYNTRDRESALLKVIPQTLRRLGKLLEKPCFVRPEGPSGCA
jgi:hypothetical protein